MLGKKDEGKRGWEEVIHEGTELEEGTKEVGEKKIEEGGGLGEGEKEEERRSAEASFYFWLSSMHSVLIGPGLGRSVTLRAQILEALEKGKGKVVLDADAFWHILRGKERGELVEIVKKMGRRVILTPNIVEAGRLIEGLLNEVTNIEGGGGRNLVEEGFGREYPAGKGSGEGGKVALVEVKEGFVRQLMNLSKFFGGAIILCKGERDLITDGEICWEIREPGCWKRSGGKQ